MENEILKGIISKIVLLNIYRNSVLDGKLPNRSVIKAEEFMTSNLISLDVNDTIGLAADIFLSNKVHSLPLFADDKLAGIITNHDIPNIALSFNLW